MGTNFNFKILANLGVALTLCACSLDMRPGSEKYQSISKERPLNSVCSIKDSASVRRESQHPLGPTGGWLYKDLTLVDYKRVMPHSSNFLTMKNGCISGFVKFDKPGYLQARSYDDFYGDVYCGWSDEKIHIKPVKEPVFVSISTCSVGDGGLDQIHEVAWFADGAKEGVLVFSSAHPQIQTLIGAADLYQKKALGNENFFNSQYAKEVLHSSLAKGDLNLAKRIVQDSFSILSGLRDAIDSKTQTPIKARNYHAEDWAMILSYSLGLQLDSKDFERDTKEMQDIVSGPGNSSFRHTNCKIQKDMSNVYVWLHKRIMGQSAALPVPEKSDENICGYSPVAIANYFEGKLERDKFLQQAYPNQDFWMGIERYLAENKSEAKAHLLKYQKESKPTEHGFEPAACALLLKRLEN